MDHDDILAAERAMTEAVKDMEGMIQSVALARQVVEFAGERRKSALARIVVRHLDSDMSGVESEHRARADEQYRRDCQTIMKQTANAEETLLRYEVAKNKFESARSILSVRRAQIGIL